MNHLPLLLLIRDPINDGFNDGNKGNIFHSIIVMFSFVMINFSLNKDNWNMELLLFLINCDISTE